MQNNLAFFSDSVSTSDHTYQSGVLELKYCSEFKILHMFWSSKLTKEELENGYEIVLNFIKVYKPKKYLLDLHLRDELLSENKTWFFETVIPKILQEINSTTFLAAIVPVEYYSNLTDEFNTDSLPDEEQLLIIDHFLLPDMGLNWLKSLG